MADRWPSSFRGWATVAILIIAYILSMVDRQILTLLIDPIKSDLGITDFQFSLLVGLAFTMFYGTMAVPLAWLADHYSRRNLILCAVLFWSVMTASCGFVGSFATLFIARAGVGLGECGLNPAAYSLIADSFPPERRARAYSLFSLGPLLGSGLALLSGGAILAWLASRQSIVLPLLGELRSWQAVFLIVAIPGIPVAALLALLREPVRRGVGSVPDARQALRFFKSRLRTIAGLIAGFSFMFIAPMGFLIWTPAILTRAYGWEPSAVGFAYGLILLICCPIGVFLGGLLVEYMTRRGDAAAIIKASIIGALMSAPFAVLAPLMPTSGSFFTMLAISTTLQSLLLGLPGAAFEAVAPNRVRARLMAVYFLVSMLITVAMAPAIVAAISDHLFGDPARIGEALSIVIAITLPLAVASFAMCLHSFAADVARAQD